MTLLRTKFSSVILYGIVLFSVSGCLDLGEPVVVTSSAAPAPTPTMNNAPVISGVPPTVIKVGVIYSFTPSASDPDNDSLTFSVQNQPGWAAFDVASGELSGMPLLGSEGTYNNVVITASDGDLSASLADFSITVESATANNSSPTISGVPGAAINVGANYSFVPASSDPDGDNLTFSVTSLPGWASFDTATGALTGTPIQGDEAVYGNIVITVSDGALMDSLPAFSITVTQVSTGSVTLTWTPPTENTDGTALTDLAGYMIRYGTASGNYNQTIRIDNAGLSTFVVENLAPNTYYFVATAFNSDDVESAFSNEAIKISN